MSLSSFSCIFSQDQHSGATVCIHRYCIMHRLLISWPSSGGSSQKWTLPRCLPIATSSIHLPIHSATVEMWRQAPPALKHWLQNQKWPPTETVWSTIMQILGSADGPRQSCHKPTSRRWACSCDRLICDVSLSSSSSSMECITPLRRVLSRH